MEFRTAIRAIAAIAAILVACPGTCRAIDVSEVRWGFDGQVTQQHFVPLSVLITNPAAEAFDGVIELRESIGAGTPVGAPLAEEVYVAPHSSRWVQFYPFVKENFEEWKLQWGRGSGERADVTAPVFAEAKPVLLVDADDFSTKGKGLRRFPENLFPPFVAATDGLKTAVLDHAPRWEEARRQAFYDWLFRGGRLDLFKGIDGNFPRFTAQLVELNTPAEHFRVGSGEVFRHDKPLGPNDAALLEPPSGASDKQAADKKTPDKKNAGKNKPDKLFNAATGKTAGSAKKTAPANPEDDEDDDSQVQVQVGPGGVTRNVTYGRGQIPDLFPDLSAGLLTFLKSLTRPRHNWVLIYSLAIAYVITVIPGVYVLGRNRYDYRIVYGVLIGLIVLFSFGFAWFGRRGHNEANAVNTIAVARPLPGGAWDVSSWTNVFVINGADYELVHGGSGRLYSTAQTFEAVNGVIRNGAHGRFDVDIPPYSSQAFVGRMKIANDPHEVTLQQFAGDTTLTKLVLATGTGFPPPGETGNAYALYRNSVYPLRWSNGRFELDRTSEPLFNFLASVDWNKLSPYGMGNMRFSPFMRPADQPATDVSQYETLFRPLVAWSLGLKKRDEIVTFRLPDEAIRVFLWSPLPKSLELVGPHMGKQQGRVLYVLDFPKPVKT